jgi:RNA polymerase sigma factor (TIGR02999 family)
MEAEDILPLVYDELRRLAAARLRYERPGQTLQPTALVHEAYLRLVDVDKAQPWAGKAHFFAAAAEAMRRLLVERARRRGRRKHGGDRHRVDIDLGDLWVPVSSSEDLLALDEALDRLRAEDPVKAQLVTLRYFGGLTEAQAAEVLSISRATANRYWRYARAWLHRRVVGDSKVRTPQGDGA